MTTPSDRYANHDTAEEFGLLETTRRFCNDLMLPQMWALVSQPGGITLPEILGHWRFKPFSPWTIKDAFSELKHAKPPLIEQVACEADIAPLDLSWVAISGAAPVFNPAIWPTRP